MPHAAAPAGRPAPAGRDMLHRQDIRRMSPPDPSAEDAARLLQLAATGNREAFARLYDRFAGLLHAVALRVLRDAAEAEDVLHDTFVAIWQKSRYFDATRGSATAWLVTLARNRAIDRVRSRRRRADLLDSAAPADLGYADNPSNPTHDLACNLARKESSAAVRAAVALLPAEQREALELAFFGGFTQQEISARLAAPLGTVKARIRRGLLRLRDTLAHRP